ncbi:T9SS type A sorting domain-containing protein [Oceanihabitans sp. 2_MG-2023]|uniref:T9SS type A sorting domain-containing protein n=1 Tax=Oceanihabitans sp. 2_MG-2023 TaxID=3062661 RepID=UPI0026E3A050|nr:T9SS type A sorting domain-containing protein [Oceanihabitans sp. 2_MG-2023]MDO6595684.1 T9SS type A sorting domain-containing protein [Oceanihabitans sp. 2_MG-2023]
MKKNYALILIACLYAFVSGFAQVTIGIQDFETSPATPTMTYTGGSIATGTGPFPAGDNNFVSGTRAIEESNGTSTVIFANVDASAYTNIYFTCRLASFSGSSGNGADGADDVFVDISNDGGTTWLRQLQVRGYSNARWSFDSGTGTASTTYDNNNTPTIFAPTAGGNRTTDGYSTIIVDGLPSVNNLKVRLVMDNNSSNEYWIVDDAEIIGTNSTPTTNITATPTTIPDLDYVFGTGPSAPQSFDVTGTLLTDPSGTTITSTSTDFEVSLTAVGGYGASVNIPLIDANSTIPIYTRLVAGLAVNTYSNTITIANATSGLGTTPTINVSGEVTPAPPTNDDCLNATILPVATGTSCTPTTYTTVNATNSGATTTCNGYSTSADIWFEITVPASGELNIETTAGVLTDGVMALYSGTCGSLTQIDCDDDTNGTMPELNVTGLTPGDTLYLLFWEYGGNNDGDFGICAWSPAPLAPCAAPSTQPTSLSLSNITGSSIDGSFTATTADDYLVVVSTSATLGANPVDNTSYTTGDTIGSGTVVQSSNATTFTATGLSQTTQYYFFVFALNDSSCTGGPIYNTTAPLTNDATTISGPCIGLDDFDASLPSGYTLDGTYRNTGSAYSGTYKIGFNDPGDDLELPTTSNPASLSFWARLSSGSGSQIKVQYDNGGTWTDIGTTQTVTGTTYTQYTFDLSLITALSNVDIRINMVTENNSVYLDDLEVYCGTPCTPPSDPTGVISSIDAPDFCETAELDFSGTAPTDIIYYWQTDAAGVDTTNNTTSALNVTTDGDYYVRAFNTTTSCWSSGVVGPYTVTISNLPVITDQPDNINVTNGSNATFTATATGATSYQWEVSTDGGTSWTNTGTNANTLTVLSASISMHGYVYRITATNSCGDSLSDEAVLFVHSGSPCIDEDFVGFPNTGWTNSGTINETSGAHAGVAQPCRVFGTNDAIITEATDYPTILEFYQDSSVTAHGSIATVDYRIGAGAWTILHTFSVTEDGKTELVDLTDVSGINLASNADVSFRFNSTFNTWYLDDVKVYCTPCTPPTTTTTINLSSGPIGAYVTISGSQLGSATISFNGTTLTPVSQDSNEVVIQIPANAVDGSIIIETNSIICDSAFPFNVINEEFNCETNIVPAATDLFIYELFDEDQDIDGSGGAWGNGGMITVYNATLETKDLSEYRLYRTTDHTDTVGSPYAVWHSLTGTLAPGEIYRIRIDGSNCTDYPTPYETAFIGFNANDGVELRKNNGSGSYTTIDQLHTGNLLGYRYLRDLTVAKPVATYNAADWAFTDVYPSSPYCVGAGQAPDFEGGTPTISLDTPITSCTTFEITANATEGYTGIYAADSYDLTFQWYYYDGVNDLWNPISTGGDYTITNTATQSTLIVDNIISKTDYQFYCEVSEGAGCYTTSEAIKPELNTLTWDGTSWTGILPPNNTPDSDKLIIIDGDYNTTTNGSFSACQLVVNAGNKLIITSGHYVEVITNVDIYGNGLGLDGVLIEDKGSFVQHGDGINAGTYTLHPDALTQVNKRTAPLNNYYEYTYWSSPVVGETIGNGLQEAHNSRRFWYDATNYLDATAETNNNNGTVNGQDDIDDNGDDWQFTSNSDIMQPGVGYAAMHNQIGFGIPGANYEYTFEGALNTGDYTVPLYRNDSETNDNNWNFIGNPYASAIDADIFLTANTAIDTNVSETTTGVTDGAIFLWSQDSPYSDTNNGNQVLNFAQSDYAVINGTGQTAGGDGIEPDRFIPSGQGFFISMSDAVSTTTVSADIETADVLFNNTMRVTGNNSQFFRSSSSDQANKLWLNLTTDSGVFNQILIGYVPGATNDYDGMYYDAPKNLATDAYASLYSIIEEVNGKDKLAIQGKSPESLHAEEVIPIGFNTSIEEATIYTFSIPKLEGEFLTNNSIYVHDKLMQVYHDLKASDYNFTSDSGSFTNRFDIVFNTTSLSVNENEYTNALTIIEQADGSVQFNTSNALEIKNVKIYDVLGRLLYNLNGNSSTEIYHLDNLSQATYVAKVTLSNDVVITKKAVKRN